MDGLYSRRRRRKLRLGYLKERGGLCRVIELVLLGAVLGFLGLSPGSFMITFHAVMTSLVVGSVSAVLLAHLVLRRPRLRCCCCVMTSKSWAIVETVHDAVGMGLLVPGALLLLVPPLDSSLTVACVLTLMALVILGIQGIENFQRARGYTVPSRLTTPVPIVPLHTHPGLSSHPLDPPGTTAPPANHTTSMSGVPPPPGEAQEPRTRQTLEMSVSNVTQAPKSQNDSRAMEEPAPSPALAETAQQPPATQRSTQERAVSASSPATSRSWSTLFLPLLSPVPSDTSTASEVTETMPLITTQRASPPTDPPAFSAPQEPPSPAAALEWDAPSREHSTPSCFLMPRPTTTTTASPVVFLTPRHTPSSVFTSFASSVYYTPEDPDLPPATQHSPPTAGSASSGSSEQSPGRCSPPANVGAPGFLSTPTAPERKAPPTRSLHSREERRSDPSPPPVTDYHLQLSPPPLEPTTTITT